MKRAILSLLSAITILFGPNTNAQIAGHERGGTVPFRLLGDRILIRAALETETWSKETHIILDYARPTAVELVEPVITAMTWGDNDQALKITAKDFLIEVPRDRVVQTIDSTPGDLTTRFDSELDQTDVAAIIGWQALKDWAVRINFEEQTLALTPGISATVSSARTWAATVVDNVRVFDDQVFVPLNFDGGKPAWMALDTAGYHTWIDQPIAESQGKLNGNLGGIHFGAGNEQALSGLTALRPTDFSSDRQMQYEADIEVERLTRAQIAEQIEQLKTDEAEIPESLVVPFHLIAKPIVEFDGTVLLRSGISLLSAFELEINPVGGYLALLQTVDSNYSDADEKFYAAVATKSMDDLIDFLEQYPEDRNVEEGVEIAFDLGIERGASVSEQMNLVEIGVATTQIRRQFHYVFEFMFKLYGDEALREAKSDLIIALGEKAMRYVGRAQSPRLRQQTQLMLGDRYMAKNDAYSAWKYFLAAAFNGDPQQDGIVRFELGRAYEALGRHRRAYSSYRRALSKFVELPPHLKERAEASLRRLRPQLDADDPLLAEDG